ncbi:MAG: hypothetical protein M1830_008310 [Pleopsidium flavum]|nr:MAG: hypothetical protein M1830_008310 [Pleopsidium flavum]
MELMRDWLGPTIENQLHHALQWKGQGFGGFQALGGVAYEDDGSNLRVKLKKGGHLQIVKLQITQRTTIQFETYEDPIKALLSDSHSSIQATFASSAVKEYTAKHRRRITEQAKGAIIGISEYEIVATHLGPEQSSVTLLVQDLQFCGCQGSGTFGRPVPVERRHRASKLVRQLRELKSVEVLDSSHQSQKDDPTTPSPVRSQVEAVTSDGGSDAQENKSVLATQVGFVSQMPRNKQSKSAIVSESALVQNPRHRPNPEQNASEQYTMAPSATKAKRKSTTHPDKLLALLTGAQNPRAAPRTDRPIKASRTLEVSVSKTSPGPANNLEKATEHSETVEGAKSRQSEPPVSSNKKLANGEATATLQSGAIRNYEANINGPSEHPQGDEASAEQSRSRKSVLFTGQEAEDGMKRIGQGNMQARIAQIEVEEGKKFAQISNGSSVALSEEKKVEQHAIDDPWKGMTRIRRRHVRIPKDQQGLLDRDDSWLPPEPGSRGPIANVPITVLQALNAVAERRASKSKLVDGQKEVNELHITEPQQRTHAPSDAGSESEHDLDGEQLSGWSASSSPSAPGDQLPPDSSLEVSEASPQVSRKDSLGDVAALRGTGDMRSSQTNPPRCIRGDAAALEDSVIAAQLVPDHAPSQEAGLPAEGLESPLQLSADAGEPLSSQISESLGQLEHSLGNGTSIHQADAASGAQVNGWQTQSGMTQVNIGGEHTSPKTQEDVRVQSQRPGMQSQISSHSVYLSSEEEEDSLESIVPNALITEATKSYPELENGIAEAPPPPTTALQDRKPTLQVKRTPYVSGETARISRSSQTSLASLSLTGDESPSESVDARMSAEYVMSSNSVVPGTHYAQYGPAVSNDLPPELGLDGFTDYVNTDEDEAMLDQQIHSEIDAQSQRSLSMSPSKERTARLSSTEIEHESDLPPVLHRDPLRQIPSLTPIEGEHGKRKAAVLDQLSPFVTKRRKRVKPPPAFNFSQDNRETQDPSLLARAHRREFFTSRRLDTAKIADGTVDKTPWEGYHSEEIAGDANQSTNLFSAELAPMEVDRYSPETDLRPGFSETVLHKADNGLSEQKSPLVSTDYTPQNMSLATGIDVNNFMKPAGSATLQKPLSSAASRSNTPTPANGTIYDHFRSTYPDYTGELKHFLAMCHRIDALHQADRMEHRSLWDDFIIRHRIEYRKYLFDCTDKGEDPIPYEKFYRDEIDEPLYIKRILTPASLKDAISSVAGPSVAQHQTGSFTSSGKAPNTATSAINSPALERTPKTADQEIVDLTLQDPSSKGTLTDGKVPEKRRSLPWIKSTQTGKTPSPSRTNKNTPRLSLVEQSTPHTQTPSRASRLAQKAAQERTPGQRRARRDQSPLTGQSPGIVSILPIDHDLSPWLAVSRESKLSQETVQERTPGQCRPGFNQPPSIVPPADTMNTLPDHQKLTPRPGPSASNLPIVVDCLDNASSDTTSSPIPEPHERDGEEPDQDQWWRDRNTPFKTWVRAYASLKSVEGNLGEIDREGVLRARVKQVDVLDWRL